MLYDTLRGHAPTQYHSEDLSPSEIQESNELNESYDKLPVSSTERNKQVMRMYELECKNLIHRAHLEKNGKQAIFQLIAAMNETHKWDDDW